MSDQSLRNQNCDDCRTSRPLWMTTRHRSLGQWNTPSSFWTTTGRWPGTQARSSSTRGCASTRQTSKSDSKGYVNDTGSNRSHSIVTNWG